MTREPTGTPGKPRRGQGTQDPAFYDALGRAIKVARADRGLERKELAEMADVSYPYLADIESGRGRPTSTVLLAIAKQRPCAGRIAAVFRPITSARVVTSGPPEFPGLSAASV